MRLRRWICMILVCMLVMGCFSVPAEAAAVIETTPERIVLNSLIPRATNSFSMTIPANTALSASSSFPLAAGETVTIKASYYPFSASIDVGLIAPDGNFYYVTVTNGSIDTDTGSTITNLGINYVSGTRCTQDWSVNGNTAYVAITHPALGTFDALFILGEDGVFYAL